MDTIDFKIIDILKENSRSTTSEISKKVKLSIPAVAERIRKMEEAEIIEKYTVKVNREEMNYKILAFIFINIDKTKNVENFREAIVQYNNVLECHHITGEYDYLLKVLVEDTKSLEYFISNMLKKITGVFKSNTMISLSSLKEEINI
ncbi:Lrp/AsnC family transcriptional regulator [Clostridium formicaceticum]|uniref:Leucine-responsive regulatory protein n=1 Tax=Clostridium formicaceticum TaxID=1497 RepID=A0AAC9RP50_9CLOT|nr:Lrp/AsnC family transcriptional regulator [Clostridium formicaceticum]AOY78065.1 transcriptional regulator [Clostridium formicaceticum]ARE88705.1 Leucine-responsive regulatory protein [Clostridium formicaceticum]